MENIETKRLNIKELRKGDAQFMFRLMNSAGWLEFIGNRGIKNEEDAENYILNNILPSYTRHGFGLYKMILKDNREPIGICGLLQRDYLKHPDLGFAILPEFAKKGFTLEASNAILKHAKKNLQIQSVEAITAEGNKASINLLKKIGFLSQEKITRAKEGLLLFRKHL
ncbi:GNAT family N-acetyltransferase [Croceitalea rosinachiae]|uniref:GNAT family N-acetyltransferase n=1 Tax=Croceitalea rosinachiae TaxID=3075596 RepID=A0ABU3ADU3_9FLAO|nr:GNAT family N-acetyltransferase [Croceitalea sp. F388]MDT0607682.1 GNAT family N-acetyltransferase [Croceitalea sp. F388]